MKDYYDWYEFTPLSNGALHPLSNEAIEEEKVKRAPIGFQMPKEKPKQYRHTQIYPRPE